MTATAPQPATTGLPQSADIKRPAQLVRSVPTTEVTLTSRRRKIRIAPRMAPSWTDIAAGLRVEHAQLADDNCGGIHELDA